MKKWIVVLLVAGCGAEDPGVLAPAPANVPAPSLSGSVVPGPAPSSNHSLVLFASQESQQPPHGQSQFSLADAKQVYAYIFADDIGGASFVTIEWRTPQGDVFQQSSQFLLDPLGSGGVSLWDSLQVAGGPIAQGHMTGHWWLRVTLDNGNAFAGSFALTD